MPLKISAASDRDYFLLIPLTLLSTIPTPFILHYLRCLPVLCFNTATLMQSLTSQLTPNAMKKDIHPLYKEINVVCSCGNSFVTRSTAGKDLHPELCANCHPFYTGKQKISDTVGRVNRFKQRYGNTKTAS